MNELSLHILDISYNSISAGASRIEIRVTETKADDLLVVEILDNGSGMSPDFLEKAADPFTTTRKTRRVGLGLPFFKMAAEQAGGKFKIESSPGKGTTVSASFGLSHIDRMPLGNMPDTVATLIMAKPEIEFIYERTVDGARFKLDTAEAKKMIGDIPINSPEVLEMLREIIFQNEKELCGGA